MQLNELKKSMSTLEQVLAKTNSDIKINVSTSQPPKLPEPGYSKKSVKDLYPASSSLLFSQQWHSAT